MKTSFMRTIVGVYGFFVKMEFLVRGGGIEGGEEGAGFAEDVLGFGGGEGPAEGALRGELGSAFGVAADQLHEHGGVYGCLRFVGEVLGVGVDCGEFDVEHLDEGFEGVFFVAVEGGEFAV